MRIINMPLRSADGDGSGGGGGGAPLALDINILPQELRGEASLASIKTIPDLAKSYVNAQKLIGAKRIALPSQDAPESQWNEFYNSIGRPESWDKYEDPKVKVDESLKPDPEKLKEVKQHFHKLGLTTRQANSILEYYLNSTNSALTAQRQLESQTSEASVSQLKQEWGDKFTTKLDLANSVLKKFGNPELAKYLDQSNMGNNVHLIKLLSSIGDAIMEDHERGGSGELGVSDRTRAMHEIESLKTDSEFQKMLLDASHPAHKAAATRWANLFAVAFPGAAEE